MTSGIYFIQGLYSQVSHYKHFIFCDAFLLLRATFFVIGMHSKFIRQGNARDFLVSAMTNGYIPSSFPCPQAGWYQVELEESVIKYYTK